MRTTHRPGWHRAASTAIGIERPGSRGARDRGASGPRSGKRDHRTASRCFLDRLQSTTGRAGTQPDSSRAAAAVRSRSWSAPHRAVRRLPGRAARSRRSRQPRRAGHRRPAPPSNPRAARASAPPPMKMADGTGSPASSPGRPLSATHDLQIGYAELGGVPGDPLRPVGSRSTAMARQLGSARHHSIATDPAPAPRSQSSSPGRGASLASTAARTSRLVSWPSWSYASSGSPGVQPWCGAAAVGRQSRQTTLSWGDSSCHRSRRRLPSRLVLGAEVAQHRHQAGAVALLDQQRGHGVRAVPIAGQHHEPGPGGQQPT